MSMQTGDELISTSRGDVATAVSYGVDGNAARQDFMREYIETVYALCAQEGMIDASIVIGQSVHETSDPGPWQSYWWRERGNPAGMGVTGDPAQNDASPTFETGEEAARGQVSHLLLYATGRIDRGGLTSEDDPRYDAYVDAYGHTAQATTIQGLTGKWGVDPQYGAKLCDRGNDVYPGLPNQESGGNGNGEVVFGRVPHPPVDKRDIPTPPNTAWDDLGPRVIRAITWHRMLGSLWGTDSYFRDASSGGGATRALTDYGLGVVAQDGQDDAGHLMRWNDPRGRRSPWANGKISSPYGDGAAFINIYGTNAVNRDITSLEISGFETTPLDEAARDVIAGLTAYWADQYHVSWETFPHLPAENNRSFVIWHQEFTIGTGKECPFDLVMAETTALIDRARDVLRQYQTSDDGEVEPEPPTTDYPAARVPAPDVIEAQGFALVIEESDRWRCTHGGRFKTYPHRDAPDGTPSPYAANKVYTLPYSTVVDDEIWLVSKAGSWCLAKNFTPAE